MSHLRCSLLTALALLITINMQHQAEVSAGPLSLSFARSFRSGRQIRAPFKPKEIMVARGFGKRNVLAMPARIVGGVSSSPAATATFDGHAEKSGNLAGNSLMTNMDFAGSDGSTIRGSGTSNIPIDWLATEMAANPNLARLILQRFFAHELVSSDNANDNFEYY